MDDPCHIRPARPADLDAIVAIERESFSDPWSATALRDLVEAPAGWFLVAVVDDHVAGYAVAHRVLDTGEIQNLAVAGRHRRRGVGQALVRQLLDELVRSGVRRVFLEVRASNQPARALYAAFGFSEIARRRGYYRRPREDALVLTKEMATDGVSLIDKRT